MKNFILILSLLLSFSTSHSQNIPKCLTIEGWEKGQVKKCNDTKLLRLLGDNNENGVTNISVEIDKKYKGFTIHLYVTRDNNHFSNFRNFRFEVHDSCGVEILNQELSFKIGKEIEKKDKYFNYTYLHVPIENRQVIIYLFDKINLDGNGLFIFQTLE